MPGFGNIGSDCPWRVSGIQRRTMAIVTPGSFRDQKDQGELGDGAGPTRGGQGRRRKIAAQVTC